MPFEIHDVDRQVMQRLMGKPEIPQATQDAYFKVQRARHSASIPGNMDLATITAILLASDALTLPTAVETKFGKVKEGDKLEFRVNDYQWDKCMFIGVHSAEAHTYDIVLDGSIRTVRENQLRFIPELQGSATFPATSASIRSADLVDPPKEERVERPEIEPEPTVVALSDDEKQKLFDNLKTKFPKNAPVEVCPDGGESVDGVVSHCGNGPLLGKVAVKVKGEKNFKWFRSCDVFINDEALATAS